MIMASLPYTKLWWVPEELNLSTPAALFHSRPGYSRLSGKGPDEWCSPSDSNRDHAWFKQAASADWARRAWCHGSDSNEHCAGFEAAASYQLATVALVRAAGFEPALFTPSR